MAIGSCVAASIPFRTASGVSLAVIVKATFALSPNGTTELGDPDSITFADESRACESAPDRTTDVLLHGHAYAPLAWPVRSMVVHVRVVQGGAVALDTRLMVRGPLDPSSGEPSPFTSMPLAVSPSGSPDHPVSLDPIPLLVGDEWILVEGMSAALPRFRVRLPACHATARLHGPAPGTSSTVSLEAGTLSIDVDRLRCSIVWRAHVSLAREEDAAAMHLLASLEPVAAMPDAPVSSAEDAAQLRIAAAPAAAPTTPPPPMSAPPLAPPVEMPEREEGTLVHDIAALRLAASAMPFAPSDAPPREAAVLPAATPFEQAQLAPAPIPLGLTTVDLAPPRPAPIAIPQPEPPAPPPAPAPLPIAILPYGSPAAPITPPPPSFARVPIDTSVRIDKQSPSETVSDEPTGSAPDVPAVDAFPIERFAAILAEITEREVPRRHVLDAHGISDARWLAIEKRWSQALADEAKRGERALLFAHDEAYIASWEALRGPFEILEYARITIAAERGELVRALDVRCVRRTTWMRLKRVFGRRMAADPSLAAQVRKTLADERKAFRPSAGP